MITTIIYGTENDESVLGHREEYDTIDGMKNEPSLDALYEGCDTMGSVENDSSLDPSLSDEKDMSTSNETTTSTYQHESYYQEGESIHNAVFDLALDPVASVSKQGSLLSKTVVRYRDQNSSCLHEEEKNDQLFKKPAAAASSSQQQFTSTMQLVDTYCTCSRISRDRCSAG